MTTTLYLARHGETEENVAQILQGHLPGHLTERGRNQAVQLRNTLVQSGVSFDALLTSDLQRTIDTTQIVNEAFHLQPMLCPLLRERDWGSLTGHTIAEAHQVSLPADAETVEQLFERARQFLEYVSQTFPNQHVLCIGHGLFCRCIIAANEGCLISDVPRMQNAEVRSIIVACKANTSPSPSAPNNDPLISAN